MVNLYSPAKSPSPSDNTIKAVYATILLVYMDRPPGVLDINDTVSAITAADSTLSQAQLSGADLGQRRGGRGRPTRLLNRVHAKTQLVLSVCVLGFSLLRCLWIE